MLFDVPSALIIKSKNSPIQKVAMQIITGINIANKKFALFIVA
jgi:hypothetical protein